MGGTGTGGLGAGGNPKTTREYDSINPNRISPQNYRANIEKSYSLLSTDELKRIVNDYNAKSLYAKRYKTSDAEKVEYKVAVQILKERKGKGLEGKIGERHG